MQIKFTKSAEKELVNLDKNVSHRIFEKALQLKDNPYGLGSQKLEGGQGYRIRIGDYRVVYTIDKVSKTVIITKVGHRKEVYR